MKFPAPPQPSKINQIRVQEAARTPRWLNRFIVSTLHYKLLVCGNEPAHQTR